MAFLGSGENMVEPGVVQTRKEGDPGSGDLTSPLRKLSEVGDWPEGTTQPELVMWIGRRCVLWHPAEIGREREAEQVFKLVVRFRDHPRQVNATEQFTQ